MKLFIILSIILSISLFFSCVKTFILHSEQCKANLFFLYYLLLYIILLPYIIL